MGLIVLYLHSSQLKQRSQANFNIMSLVWGQFLPWRIVSLSIVTESLVEDSFPFDGFAVHMNGAAAWTINIGGNLEQN